MERFFYRTEVEEPSTHYEWKKWSQPVLDILQEGPQSIQEIKSKIRSMNVDIKGGLLNALCWLDLHGAIFLMDGKWVVTGKFDDRKEDFNLHEFMQEKADKYKTTVSDILSDKKIGKCVLARDEIFYCLRETDLSDLSKQTGIEKDRINNCIERFRMRKIGV